MSIIIHGPQGCGKTLNGEKLRRHFGMRQVVDADDLLGPGRLYPTLRDPDFVARIKALNAVILTCEEPPADLCYGRVMSFDHAMNQIIA